MSARVVFRADAGAAQGTGHVMRCLTLAKELLDQNLEPVIMGSVTDTEWLKALIKDSGIPHHATQPHELDLNELEKMRPDFIVIDSYEFSIQHTNTASTIATTLAISDSWNPGLATQFVLDQNLGAEFRYPKDLRADTSYLLGARYSLVRKEISRLRRYELIPVRDLNKCNLLCFFGGSDPDNSAVKLAEILSNFDGPHLNIIAPRDSHGEISRLLRNRNFNVSEFTPDLPDYIATADAVVSAAGTSTMELGTIGVPSAYVCAAENQAINFNAIKKFRTGLTIDFKENEQEIFEKIVKLCIDDATRHELYSNSTKCFDGMGTTRVASIIRESIDASP